MDLALTKFGIQAFRGLRMTQLDQLRRFNLFFGANNSGKSSLLEAISLFARPLSMEQWVQIVWLRDVRRDRQGIVDALRWIFPQPDYSLADELPRYHALLWGTGRSGDRTLRAKLQTISRPAFLASEAVDSEEPGSETGYELTLSWESLPGQTKLAFYEFWPTGEAPYPTERTEQIPLRFLSPVSHRLEGDQIELISTQILHDRKSRILELLQALDSNVTALEVAAISKRSQIFIGSRVSGMLPFTCYGDGVRRALLLAASVEAATDGILLIDEVESALHFAAMRRTFDWLREAARDRNVQVFATTHSHEVIDALTYDAAAASSDVAGYVLERRDGETPAKLLDGSLLHRLRYERGIEVR